MDQCFQLRKEALLEEAQVNRAVFLGSLDRLETFAGPAHQNLDARSDESVTSCNGSDGVVAWGARRVASDVGRSQSWMTWGVSLWRDCGFALGNC